MKIPLLLAATAILGAACAHQSQTTQPRAATASHDPNLVVMTSPEGRSRDGRPQVVHTTEGARFDPRRYVANPNGRTQDGSPWVVAVPHAHKRAAPLAINDPRYQPNYTVR